MSDFYIVAGTAWGATSIFGIVVKNEHIILLTSLVLIVTCMVVMIHIIVNCYKRNTRLKHIDYRRRTNGASKDQH